MGVNVATAAEPCCMSGGDYANVLPPCHQNMMVKAEQAGDETTQKYSKTCDCHKAHAPSSLAFFPVMDMAIRSYEKERPRPFHNRIRTFFAETPYHPPITLF